MENKIVNLQINDNINQTTDGVKSLKAQLREAQSEVNSLSDKFGATSKEAVEAAKQAAKLKDQISDAKSLTDAFNPDAKFRALTSSLSGVAGGFGAVQGGMALFGAETESVEKTLLKVQSAMALSQGIQSVGESIDSFKQLGAVLKNTSVVQKVMTTATAAYAFVTEAATGGLKLFRAALIGTGVGALVIGVGLLIANFDKVKNTIMNLIPGLANVSKFIGGIVDSITDFVGATSDATRALDKLKTDADKTLSVNKKFMQEHGDQVDEYTKKKIEAKNAYANAIKEDGADQIALAKKLNRELNDIEFSRGDEARKKQKEANEKAAADRKAENEKAIAERKANLEKENQEAKDKKEKYDSETAEGLKALNEANLQKDLEDSARKRGLLDEQIALLEEGVDAVQTSETRKNEATAESAKLTLEQEKALADGKKAIQDGSIKAIEGGLSLLKNLFEGNEEVQKGIIIAESAVGLAKMIISNNAANIAALATPQAIATSGAAAVPVIALNNISTGIGIAANIAATSKALSSLGGGGAPSASGTGGVSGGAPAAPTFNVVGQGGANQIAQSIAGQEQQPLKAYVVSNDVTTSQSLDRNITSNASMG